jgi:hypothetical protein
MHLSSPCNTATAGRGLGSVGKIVYGNGITHQVGRQVVYGHLWMGGRLV